MGPGDRVPRRLHGRLLLHNLPSRTSGGANWKPVAQLIPASDITGPKDVGLNTTERIRIEGYALLILFYSNF